MKITLINHCSFVVDSDVPIPLWPLSEAGGFQAKKLSKSPLIKDVDVLYSSLHTGSIEQTLLLAKTNLIPINTSLGLIEVSSFTTLFLEERYKDYVEDFYKNVIERIGKGETYEEALQRFNGVLDEIVLVERHRENIGIVSHTNILSMFCSRFVNRTPLEIHNMMRTPDVAVLNWSTRKFERFFGETI